MSRKLYALLLPVLAVAAMAMTAGVAQAAPKWEICKKEATATHKFSDSECQKEVANTGSWEWKAVGPKAELVQVVTFGKLKLTTEKGLVIECKVIDAGNIWNDEVGGKDEITAFTNYECKATPAEACPKPELIPVAKSLPWPTEVIAGTPPTDKIGTAAKPIEIAVFCAEKEQTVFKGELSPKLINPTEAHPLQAEFTSATGTLSNGVEKAKVEGKDSILTEEDQQIKVK
jgi:hypothetical protein